jgi:hypothetical protein
VVVVPYFPSRGAADEPSLHIPYFTAPGDRVGNRTFFRTACRERGFEIADPEPLFASEHSEHGLGAKGVWVAPSDADPNATGHRLIADAVEQAIRERECRLTCGPDPASEGLGGGPADASAG